GLEMPWLSPASVRRRELARSGTRNTSLSRGLATTSALPARASALTALVSMSARSPDGEVQLKSDASCPPDTAYTSVPPSSLTAIVVTGAFTCRTSQRCAPAGAAGTPVTRAMVCAVWSYNAAAEPRGLDAARAGEDDAPLTCSTEGGFVDRSTASSAGPLLLRSSRDAPSSRASLI